MKSRNEEYLDGLLQALKKDANSGIAKTSFGSDLEDEDLSRAIENSSENSDLKASSAPARTFSKATATRRRTAISRKLGRCLENLIAENLWIQEWRES